LTDETARLRMASLKGRSQEEAVAQGFEMKAYGKLNTVTSLMLNRHMPKSVGLGK